MAGAINKTRSITTEQDEVDLLTEINDLDLPMKLMESHEYTRKIFTSSGVRLHKIISLQIVIQKEPYFWANNEE
jgi:biotin synthase-like enzyme